MKCINPECDNTLAPTQLKYCGPKCARKVQNARERRKWKAKVKRDGYTQGQLITSFFLDEDGPFTPWQVQDYLPEMLITSIRRAIHKLEKKGILIRTEKPVIERHGEENFRYKIRPTHRSFARAYVDNKLS